MKIKIGFILLPLIGLLLSCQGTTKSKNEFNFYENGVIAHRGAWKNTGETENSLGSLREAIKLNCTGSEFDIHLTADDSLVVYHNQKHHNMVIDSTNYEQLTSILLDNGEKLPTAREYLMEGMKQKQTKLIIDIKVPQNKSRTKQIAIKALALVKELGAEPWVEFLGSDIPSLEYLRINSDLPVAYLGLWLKEIPEMHPDSVAKMDFKYIDYQDMHYKEHPEWIDIFKEAGVHLNVWVVNTEEDMNWFIEKQFDYITTNEPELLLKKLNKL